MSLRLVQFLIATSTLAGGEPVRPDLLPDLPAKAAAGCAARTAQARIADGRGDFKRVVEMAEGALAIYPHVADCWFLLARARLQLGDSEAATKALLAAAESGFADVERVTGDTLLAPLLATPALRDWLARVRANERPLLGLDWPRIEPALLVADAGQLRLRHADYVARLERFKVIDGERLHDWQQVRLDAWQAASWDAIAARQQDPEIQASARLSALRIVAGEHPKRAPVFRAREALRRATELVAAHPESRLAIEGALTAARTRLGLARAASPADPDAGGIAFGEELDALVTRHVRGPAVEEAVFELFRLRERGSIDLLRSLLKQLEASSLHSPAELRERLQQVAPIAFYTLNGVPSLQATTTTGQAITDEGLRGHVVLLDFWATWCPACRTEIPGLRALYERYRESGLMILGISQDSPESVSSAEFVSWCQEARVTWPQIYMPTRSDEIGRAFGVRSLPFPVLLDREGQVVATGAEARGRALEANLERLLRPTTKP